MSFLSKFNTSKPADKLSSEAVETSTQQVRRLLREVRVDKLDLYDLVQSEEYLPMEFVVFVNRHWEKGSGRDLVAKYLGTVQRNNVLSVEQKNSTYDAISKLLEASQRQNTAFGQAVAQADPRMGSERTGEFVLWELQKLSPSHNRIEVFLKSLDTAMSSDSPVQQRMLVWVREREIRATSLDDWYSRARNLLLLSGHRSGVVWLDRQMLNYVQKYGQGLEVV